MTKITIRQLPDGRHVERDNSGVLYLVTPGVSTKELVRNSQTYIALGLRSDLDDRALYNAFDTSTINDPHVLVWDGATQRYVTRAETSAPGTDPTGTVIGPYEPPPRINPGAGEVPAPNPQQAPGTLPPTNPVVAVATGVASAPAPSYVPVPGPLPVPPKAERTGLLARIKAWLRRVFG
jgi:hypothetical protein